MLIDMRDLKAEHGMRITGVLHVGAHACEEAPVYAEIVEPGGRVVWVEGNPELAAGLRARGFDVREAVVAEEDGREVDFILTNNGQSSSILELKEHLVEHPHVREVGRLKLRTTTLETLLTRPDAPPCEFNFLNLDVQGAELLALRGLGERLLAGVDYVYTEVNVKELYAGCATLEEMDAFLCARGFRRKNTLVLSHGWGDALYVRGS